LKNGLSYYFVSHLWCGAGCGDGLVGVDNGWYRSNETLLRELLLELRHYLWTFVYTHCKLKGCLQVDTYEFRRQGAYSQVSKDTLLPTKRYKFKEGGMILVLIQWKDPGYVGSHWENREPFIEKSVSCISCGVLLHENEDDIQVILSLNNEFYSQGIAFPKSIIKKMWKLKVNKLLKEG